MVAVTARPIGKPGATWKLQRESHCFDDAGKCRCLVVKPHAGALAIAPCVAVTCPQEAGVAAPCSQKLRDVADAGCIPSGPRCGPAVRSSVVLRGGLATSILSFLQIPPTTYDENRRGRLQQPTLVRCFEVGLNLLKHDVAGEELVRDLFVCWKGAVASGGYPAIRDDHCRSHPFCRLLACAPLAQGLRKGGLMWWCCWA